MGTLFVIAVAAKDMMPDDDERPFAVLLADGILPGHVLGRYDDPIMADHACQFFAEHYSLKSYPLDTPHRARVVFTVINGGKAS